MGTTEALLAAGAEVDCPDNENRTIVYGIMARAAGGGADTARCWCQSGWRAEHRSHSIKYSVVKRIFRGSEGAPCRWC